MSKIADTIDYEYDKLFGEDSEEQLKSINNKKIQILCVGAFIIFLIVTATIFPLLFISYSTEETQSVGKEASISNAQDGGNVGETTRDIVQDNQGQTSKKQYIPHETFNEDSETEKTLQMKKITSGQKRIRTSTPRYKHGKGSKNLDDLETSLSRLEMSSIEGSGSKGAFFDSDESENTSSEDFKQKNKGKGTTRKYKDGQIMSIRKKLNFSDTLPSNNQDSELQRLEKERLEKIERERLKNEKSEKEPEAENKVTRRKSTRLTNKKEATPAMSVPPSVPE